MGDMSFDPKTLRIAEPGLYLFVHVSPDRVEVMRAARIERAPRGQLHAPRLTADTIVHVQQSTSEVVLAIIEEDGTVTESFAWPAEAETFVDSEDDSEARQLRGSAVRESEWDARLRIPIADSARYLQFYRTDVIVNERFRPALAQKTLGLFDLKPGGPGDLPPFPVPNPYPPIPMPFPQSRVPKQAWWEFRWLQRMQSKSVYVSPGGYIKDARTVISTGDPATKFDVVITGDGFLDSELTTFDHYAALAIDGLTTTLPFSNFADRINVHVVRVVSFESGISRCPDCNSTAIKNTYFKTTGCWNNTSSPTYIGTQWKWRILDAVDTIIPQQYADLVITIVNCAKYGGSAPPELGLAFLTTDPNETRFRHTVTHESGHVIAKLCEEYNPCNVRDASRTYPNEATQAEVDAGAVWWKSLALPSELDSAGQFKVIHKYGDPITGTLCQPNLPLPEYAMLGAFWGCHNGDLVATNLSPAIAFCDPRGKHYYRPMSECRMRYHTFGFCRVCSWLISEAILAVAP